MLKMKVKKISVKEIGKLIKIMKSIVKSMIRLMVGLLSLGCVFIRFMNYLLSGISCGVKIVRISYVSVII